MHNLLVADSCSRQDGFERLDPQHRVGRNVLHLQRTQVLRLVEDSSPREEDSRRQREASKAAHNLEDFDHKRLLRPRVYLEFFGESSITIINVKNDHLRCLSRRLSSLRAAFLWS